MKTISEYYKEAKELHARASRLSDLAEALEYDLEAGIVQTPSLVPCTFNHVVVENKFAATCDNVTIDLTYGPEGYSFGGTLHKDISKLMEHIVEWVIEKKK